MWCGIKAPHLTRFALNSVFKSPQGPAHPNGCSGPFSLPVSCLVESSKFPEAACDTIDDLLSPIDIGHGRQINMLGDPGEGPVSQPSPVTGIAVGELVTAGPKEFRELTELIQELGAGDTKKGMSKALPVLKANKLDADLRAITDAQLQWVFEDQYHGGQDLAKDKAGQYKSNTTQRALDAFTEGARWALDFASESRQTLAAQRTTAAKGTRKSKSADRVDLCAPRAVRSSVPGGSRHRA